MPTVRAIIPAYNAEATLARAIDSCVSQTHPLLEIIVVDDGSTDGTVDIARGYPEPVRLECKTNGGPSSARNHGARVAQGGWLPLPHSPDPRPPPHTAKPITLPPPPP